MAFTGLPMDRVVASGRADPRRPTPGGNHLRWPNGVDDGSGIDHEPAFLDSLRSHPLSPPPPLRSAARLPGPDALGARSGL